MTELSRLRTQIEAFAPYNEQEEADRQQGRVRAAAVLSAACLLIILLL